MAIDNDARGLAGAALGAANARAEGYFPIGCRASYNFNRTATTDALPAMLCRSRHVLPYGAKSVMPVYVAGYAGVGERETAGFVNVHVGLAPTWNAPATSTFNQVAIRPVTINGRRELGVPIGEYRRCDPIGVKIAAGNAIGLHVYGVGNTAAPLVGGREVALAKSWGEEFSRIYASTSDLSLTSSGYPAASYGYGAMVPAVLLGQCPDGRRRSSVAIVGHSIVYGQVSGGGQSNRDTGDNDGNVGWIERTIASTRPFSAFTAPGDCLLYWMGNNNSDRANQRFGLLSLGFTDLIIQIEVNDFGSITVDQYQEIFRGFVDRTTGLGIRVHACTPMPQSNSSNSWTDLAGQTKSSKSDMLVDWAGRLRTNAISWGCSSVIDLNAVTADPTATWAWRTSMVGAIGTSPTLDGTHPTQAMNVWLAAQAVFNPLILIPEFPT